MRKTNAQFMVKVKPSLTVHLGSGQKITLDLTEARELFNSLTNFVQSDSHFTKTRVSKSRGRKATRQRKPTKIPSLRESKRREILSHVGKQLSAKPRTLSNLLKGVSYMPNHLPLIRKLVENQPGVSKKRIGKRMFYLNKTHGPKSENSRNDVGATAA